MLAALTLATLLTSLGSSHEPVHTSPARTCGLVQRPSSPGGNRRRSRLLPLRCNWLLGVFESPDYLIGAQQDSLWNGDAENSCGLDIDD